MSRLSQLKYLKRLQIQLTKDSSEFREDTANKLSHTFEMTYAALRKACSEAHTRVAKDNGTTISDQESKKWVDINLKRDILECIAKTKRNIINYRPKKNVGIKKGPIEKRTNGFSVEFIATENTGNSNIFGIIQDRYNAPLTNLYSAFEKALLNNLGTKRYKTNKKSKQDPEKFSDITQGFVFNLEHANKGNVKTSNIDLFIADKFNKTSRSRFKRAQAEEFAYYLGMDKELHLNKPSKVVVFLGSGIGNRKESSEERKRSKNIQDKLQEAILKLGKERIAQLPGSDSLIDAKQKEVTKKLEKAFKSSKNLRVSFKDNMKLDNGSGKAATINIKPRVRVVGGAYQTPKPKIRVMAGIGKQRIRGPASMPLYLIGLINRDLTRTVANNMESPALNYRTGRFASSVRVTDVLTTPQGFPSIGYTYMKSPYQTFEPGFAQGDPNRDPRKLIDRSIREIASQYAIGRFYTRRV